MSKSQFCLFRKALLPLLFVLFCLPVAGLAQSAEQGKDADKALTQNVEFKNASLRSALAVLGKHQGFEVLFDDSFKESRLSIELNDVTLKAAMKTIFDQHKLQARLLEEKKIVIFPDNEANRLQYDSYKAWPEESEKK